MIVISTFGAKDPNRTSARVGLIYPWALRPALISREDQLILIMEQMKKNGRMMMPMFIMEQMQLNHILLVLTIKPIGMHLPCQG